MRISQLSLRRGHRGEARRMTTRLRRDARNDYDDRGQRYAWTDQSNAYARCKNASY